MTDANGNTTETVYDALSRAYLFKGQATAQYAAPTRESVLNADGSVKQSIDALGRTTTFARNDWGQTTQITLPNNAANQGNTKTTQNILGLTETVTDRQDNTTRFEYDGLNRLLKRFAPDGTSVLESRTYDAYGNLETVTDAEGNTTTYVYDRQDRLIRTEYPNADPLSSLPGPTFQTVYDRRGNVVEQIDENTNSTWFVYDELDRLIEQIDQNSDSTFYTYDLLGRRTSVEDAVGNVTTFTFDTLGRVIAESIIVSGAALTRSYGYDGVGNLIRQVDRAGQVRKFAYDENDIRIGELWYTSIAAEAAGTSSYTLNSTYDVAGRLTGVADDFSEYLYLYDNTDRLTTTLDLNGNGQVVTLTNQYVAPNDPAAVRLDNLRIGLMVTLNGITFSQTDYAYDAKLRLTEISQSDGGGIDYAVRDKRVTFAYDDNNRFDEIRRYQGTTQVVYSDYNYDDLNRLEGLTYYDNGTSLTTLAFYGFEYDDKGRITKIANVDDTVDYVYDDTDQLLSATYETASAQSDEVFAYDANGNRTGSGITTGDQNQITSDGTFSYEYDANGARTRRIEIVTGKVTEYGWDIKKRLVDVDFYDDATDADADQNATKRVGYTRDMYNRVVGKTVDADGDGAGEAVETRYVYDRDQIIIEFTGGEVSGNYLWGPAVDQLLADESFDVNNPADDPDLLWALTDQLNSVRDLVRYDSATDQTNVVNHIVYDTTGNIISETDSSISILIGFTGRPFDRDSGLQDNLNRPYDPRTATFLIVDPSGFYAGDGNLYRYVGNDFVNKIDPSGLAETAASEVQSGGGGILSRGPFLYTDQWGRPVYETPSSIGPSPGAGGGGLTVKRSTLGDFLVEHPPNFDSKSGRFTIGFAATAAALVIPGAGEVQDLAVIADPNAPAWQKWFSKGSLAIGAIVGGVGPNAGTVFRIFRKADDGANVVGGAARSVNRGVIDVLEKSSKSKAAQQFEDSVIGAASDVASQKRIVPGLRFDNPNPRGRNIVRFDGRDGVELIDRKLNITTKSKQLDDLQRVSEALRQNPNVRGVIEVPNEAARRAAQRALTKANVSNITVRVAKQ